ncbi:MAG TPA: M3 family oligoendopeptidase [Nitrososphaeraceae archaeon]|jgi:oligoendopeptidase F|nr:M3 family oligoendopeptidase [Nitrososphaeraceae archaeon]
MNLLQKPKIGHWDLSELVDERKNSIKNYLKYLHDDVKKFENNRELLNNNISTQNFSKMLIQLEKISERLNMVTGFAHLQYSSNTSSNEYSALVTEMELLGTEISNKLIFFDIWFKNILTEKDANRIIQTINPVYKHFLTHKRILGKYTLSEKEEKIVNIFEVTGPNALVKIYDRMTNSFEFVLNIKRNNKITRKKFLNKEKLMSLVRSNKSEERKAAYKSLFNVYKNNSGVLGEIYLNLIVQWHDENIKIRGFDSPISVRNVYNDISDGVVSILLDTCKRNSFIFHKYFNLKAKMLKLKKLERYHLYAPLVKKGMVQKRYTYEQAVNIVLNVFESFDPKFRDYARIVFNKNHVDSEIRKGKMSGAFCSTITPKLTPYVLLNYDGMYRDISTMAHEFGHAIHSICSSNLPIAVSHAPLPLAETASVFAEMLLNEKIAEDMTEQERSILLAEQIDDMYATIMRQSYFTLFEIDAHNKVIESNANIDNVSTLYKKNLQDQFGNSVIVSDDFMWEWTYIPHFYHTPFYCYAYAFGNLLVLSLFHMYKKEGKSFIPKYLNLLSAGGSKKPETLLTEIGLDISNKSFWQQGFDLLSEKIGDLEKIV